jgi:hypothetical protein
LILIPRTSRHHKTRLGCRLNAGDAEWAERHGCRESAARTWMSVRRGPTERRRSEGTSTQSRPNQEQGAFGYFWRLFKSDSPRGEKVNPCRLQQRIHTQKAAPPNIQNTSNPTHKKAPEDSTSTRAKALRSQFY